MPIAGHRLAPREGQVCRVCTIYTNNSLVIIYRRHLLRRLLLLSAGRWSDHHLHHFQYIGEYVGNYFVLFFFKFFNRPSAEKNFSLRDGCDRPARSPIGSERDRARRTLFTGKLPGSLLGSGKSQLVGNAHTKSYPPSTIFLSILKGKKN